MDCISSFINRCKCHLPLSTSFFSTWTLTMLPTQVHSVQRFLNAFRKYLNLECFSMQERTWLILWLNLSKSQQSLETKFHNVVNRHKQDSYFPIRMLHPWRMIPHSSPQCHTLFSMCVWLTAARCTNSKKKKKKCSLSLTPLTRTVWLQTKLWTGHFQMKSLCAVLMMIMSLEAVHFNTATLYSCI